MNSLSQNEMRNVSLKDTRRRVWKYQTEGDGKFRCHFVLLYLQNWPSRRTTLDWSLREDQCNHVYHEDWWDLAIIQVIHFVDEDSVWGLFELDMRMPLCRMDCAPRAQQNCYTALRPEDSGSPRGPRRHVDEILHGLSFQLDRQFWFDAWLWNASSRSPLHQRGSLHFHQIECKVQDGMFCDPDKGCMVREQHDRHQCTPHRRPCP